MSRADELRLYKKLDACRHIDGLHGRVLPAHPYGVLISLGHRPLGVWSIRDGQFVFRDLANYEPSRIFADFDGVHRQTLALLAACRAGWAEHFDSDERIDLVA